MPTVAILGTGPSGLYLALLLAHQGVGVCLFDPKSPWDHPSGIGVLLSDLNRFLHLEDFSDGVPLPSVRFRSPKGREYLFQSTESLKMVGRDDLVRFLTKKVRETGLFISPDKVEGFQKRGDQWILRTKEREFKADFLVGADGAASFVRRGLGLVTDGEELPSMTLEVCFHLHQDLQEPALIRFHEEMPGYFWLTPRPDGTTVGLWGTSRFLHARTLFEKLDLMVYNLLSIPLPKETLRTVANLSVFSRRLSRRIAAEDWALVSDAAGLVDPLTAEGTLDGLRSAVVLADSFTGHLADTSHYLKRIQQEIVPGLKKRALLGKFVYHPWILDWLIRRASKDEKARKVLLKISFLKS